MESDIHLRAGDSKTRVFCVPALPSKVRQVNILKSFARSSFDKGFAVLALLFFAPFIAVIALAILISEGGPVFFAHKRVGKDGREFNCLKFRTMAVDAEERLAALLENDREAAAQWRANQKLDNDPRITCIGEFFRKTSLDELPQFWNVLIGDMAIVGPRPIVASETHHYGEYLSDYHSIKPGITGYWQVNGRSLTTYERRVAMDVEYVRTRTFGKDLGIILKTIKVMLLGDGAR
ncbi:sugar transferase [Sulfitobacter sabulilitoris]|uniref:Sugar transferase n=1 Tax=Sulfitobacter sabulilitoris TaxID=2562655 RepID=A0A5S3PBI5_9RHOB|nr:sugar transferase [Sulfitobacter sabulilitoris]TMM51050.1 sugar transferase [Sulfitobacter sabulilitoris]